MVYSKEYKQKITFEYPCYICGSVLSKARQTINHLENIHGYRINARSVGRRRPEEPNYVYVNDPKTRSDFEAYHCSCPSCWYHCPCDEHALTALANHINEAHCPRNVSPGKNENGNINSPQANYVARNKILPEGNSDNEDEQDELETEEEEEVKTKKGTNQQRMNDIYQKVANLTEMFKTLLDSNDKQ